MRRSAWLAIVALLFGVFFLSGRGLPGADPTGLAGSYEVIGWEPGSDFDSPAAYSGRVVLREQGAGYHFEGTVDGERFYGVGLYYPERQTLGLVFRGENGKVGETLLVREGNILTGNWIYLDGDQGKAGKEVWRRMK